MASVEDSPLESDAAATSRNLPASASMWCAVAAPFFLLLFMGFRAITFRWAFLYAVPLAGLLAIVCGIVGLLTARRIGIGRAQAWLGLSLGICIVVVAGLVGLFIWAVASGWNNSVHF